MRKAYISYTTHGIGQYKGPLNYLIYFRLLGTVADFFFGLIHLAQGLVETE